MTATLVATSGQDPRPWGERARRGFEQWSGTLDFELLAACNGDTRFVDRALPEKVILELIAKCETCPVMNMLIEVEGQTFNRCFLWALSQTQPVGFAVAGGRRWKAWNFCKVCGKRVRGIDLCGEHLGLSDPVGTIEADGTGRDYRVVADDH